MHIDILDIVAFFGFDYSDSYSGRLAKEWLKKPTRVLLHFLGCGFYWCFWVSDFLFFLLNQFL